MEENHLVYYFLHRQVLAGACAGMCQIVITTPMVSQNLNKVCHILTLF